MTSSRRRYALIVAALLGTACLAGGLAWKSRRAVAPQRVSSGRPNVVLISMDTTRADHLSCYGYSRPTSPSLERLAARGVRFANARSQAPWTLPSHMALFTSLIPSHHRANVLSGVLAPEIPTLPEILHQNGYHTAGIVNDAQMKSFWGFHRGYDQWQEVPLGSAQADCVHITDQAIAWLEKTPPDPFFLFLHFYDPHDPYDPPDEFRDRFGSTLTGAQCNRIVHRYRYPSTPVPDAEQFKEVIGSYDGEIAWLDGELGRLFAKLPENTLVVVFSDHGEAFKEHGWTMHMENLYEEDIHVALLMSLPGVLPQGQVVTDPAMLIDVAPTILGLCGIAAPAHYEGVDLQPGWSGAHLPRRPILSETVVSFAPTYDGMGLKMVALDDWKLIRSQFDGREELYHLPDEHTNLAGKETPVQEALSAVARRWLEEDDFWMAYVHGPGTYAASLVPDRGEIRHFAVVPSGVWPDTTTRDSCEYDQPSRYLRWTCTPGDKTRGLFFQVSPADANLRLDMRLDGKPVPDRVFVGTRGKHPSALPFDVNLAGAFKTAVIEKPFTADKPGFYLFRHKGTKTGKFAERSGTLDEQTLKQLRTLGYLR